MKDRVEDSYGKAAAYYLAQGSMDQMETSENQAALAQMRNMLQDNLDTTAATSAVTGATPAAQALAKKNATEAVAQGTAAIAANATSAKNQAMNNYYQANIEKNNAMNEIDKQKQSMIGNLLGSVISGGAQVASMGLA